MAHTGPMPRADAPRSRWLVGLWLVGTVAAVSLTVAAVQLAGSEVTGRPLPSVSSDHLQAALIDDALTLSHDPPEDHGAGSDATATTGAPGVEAEHPAADGSHGGGSAAEPGDDHPAATAPSVTPDDHGGGPAPTTTTTSPAHPTTTTAPPSGITYSKGFTGGTVSVRCTGNRIMLLSATPSPGFTKSVSNSGTEEIEVHFTSSSTETEVHATCSNSVVSWQG